MAHTRRNPISRRIRRVPALPALLAAAAALAAAPPAAARVRTVLADGPGDLAAVQDSVNASAPGDTVLIGPGTWTGSVIVQDKGLTLGGRDGADLTVLDGQYDGRILTVITPGGRVTVHDLTFRRGIMNKGIEFPANAGGAAAAFTAAVEFDRCNFLDNHADGLGGAVYATIQYVPGVGSPGSFRAPLPPTPTGAEAVFRDCFFEGNTAGDSGGGVFTDHTATLVLDSVFRTGSAVEGGGAALNGGDLWIEGTVFEENEGAVWGGGVSYAGHGAVTLRRVSWLGNVSPRGASFHMPGGTLEVDHCLVADEDPQAADCAGADATGSCNAGGLSTGGCLTFDTRLSEPTCSDPHALCVLPAVPDCGSIGHSDRSCDAGKCLTPVARTTWGAVKLRYR